MAKRFTDSEKWRDPWFCDLTTHEKMFWIYLLDNCNLAGIWQVNWPLVKFFIPEFEFKEDSFKDRIHKISDQKWWIKKFTDFQYGGLQTPNRLHQRILFELEKEGVSIPLKYPQRGVQDKDKDKDKEKVRGKGSGENPDREVWFQSVWATYPNKDGRKEALRHFLATVKTEDDLARIRKALDSYLKSRPVANGFVKNGSTWFNNWQDWENVRGDFGGNSKDRSGIDKLLDREVQKEHGKTKLDEVPGVFR